MDPELEAFIPLFPPADLTDPVTARKHLAELAAAAPGRVLDTHHGRGSAALLRTFSSSVLSGR